MVEKENACAITMVKDDYEFMEIWVRHHSAEFGGKQNLYVVSHGGDPKIAEICAGCNIIDYAYEKHEKGFEPHRRRFLKHKINALLEQYRNVIVLDSDEILTVDPRSESTLAELLAGLDEKVNYLHVLGVDLLHREELEPDKLDIHQKILQQRRFGRVDTHMCKPVILRQKGLRMKAHCLVNRPVVIDTRFILFHIKGVDVDLHLRTTQRRSKSAAEVAHERDRVLWHDLEYSQSYYFDGLGESELAKPFVPSEFGWLEQDMNKKLQRRNRIVGWRSKLLEIPENMRDAF